jgi:hypothetical protein
MNTLREADTAVWAAIEQAIGYCLERGVPLGAVSNGHQLVAFIGSRQDGVPPAKGKALVFPSLEAMREDFRLLWDGLSRPGVSSHILYAQLQQATHPPPPEKLSQRIVSYPGFKNRNQLATDLRILGELFIEDIAQAEELEKDFLEQTYCPSGALSQYALVSKQILKSHYQAFFEQEVDLMAQPAATKAGAAKEISADTLAASLSRRPIILLGDVGVGKTMFIRHLIAVDAEDLFERALALYVDFGKQPALATEIESFVRSSFVEQLLGKYEIDVYERNFVRGVYHSDLARFEKGIYSDLREVDPSEFKRQELTMLKEKTHDTEAHLRASLDHATKAQQRQVVIFLDNVDQRPIQFQDQAFLMAQSFAQTWPGTVFVALRPETFHRSKHAGSLAAYLPRVFTIAPPRIDLVLIKRLSFALSQLERTRSLAALGLGVTFESAALQLYVKALIHSLETNRNLVELIDNLSGGNVRRTLGFLTTFVGSGHVDSEKIIAAMEADGRYDVPVHEFLRAIIYVDHEHFDPSASELGNVFDLSSPDAREHFLLPLLLSHVERAGDIGGSEGFVSAEDVFAEGQRAGFVPSQVEGAIRRALNKRMLESDIRGIDEGEGNRYRVTTIGAYSVKRLMGQFAYVDAMIVDTPIIDASVRNQIKDARSIEDRLARADAFRRYLDDSWQPLAGNGLAFDWMPSSNALEGEIEDIAWRVAS